MEIKTIGGGERLMLCARMLDAMQGDFSTGDARLTDAERGQSSDKSTELHGELKYTSLLVLPIPTSRDKRYITGTEMSIEDVAQLCERGTLVVGYAVPSELVRLIRERGGAVADAGADEKFLLDNAILTAQAALGIILTESRTSPSELSVGVVGYGRIGAQLARLLLFLGAQVKIFTTRESVRLELCESGVNCELVSENSDFRDLDILINTAPARLVCDKQFYALPERLEIMELASGDNFPRSDRVRKLPSLPERFYPQTSANIYKNYIVSQIYASRGEVIL